MRHFPLPEPLTTTVASLTAGVSTTPKSGRLVATPGVPQRLAAGRPRAPRAAVKLPPVAPRADPHLPPTPPTQEKPEIFSHPPRRCRGDGRDNDFQPYWARMRLRSLPLSGGPGRGANHLSVLGLRCPRQPSPILVVARPCLAALRRDDAVSLSTVPLWRSRDNRYLYALFNRR